MIGELVVGARRIESPADLQRLMRADYPLSEQQWAAVTAPLRPTVVIAGAGSGKTTLMAARVVYLVATGAVRPDQILGLTFTTKAAAELRGRVMASLDRAGLLSAADSDDELLEPTVATYNASAADLIREHGLRIGHEPDTRVLTDASRYQLGARAVERYLGDVQHLTDHPPTAVQNLLALDGAMAEHLVAPSDVRRFDEEARRGFVRARDEEIAGKNRKGHREACEKAMFAIDRRAELLGLVESYRRLKADLGLMDFSDQIALGARLAEEYPEVGEQLRSRFAVVLLDEYQDTSVAQTRLLSALFSGPDADRGRGHAVMAVGDPNQAIYGWRGAAASNIVSFPQAFPALDGPVDVLPLTVNRRSDRRILHVANALAAPLYDALDVVKPLQPPAGAADGQVETNVFETQAEELAWLGEAIHADHDAGTPWSEIAVLTRDNESGALCFDALSSVGIPVEIVGLAGLLRLPEVSEVVACLTLMQDPLANAALITLLTGARWSIGPRDLGLLGARARELAHIQPRPEDGGETGDSLAQIADGLDPAEVPALVDALDDPGPAAYSERARRVFGQLSQELRVLRRAVGEPLLDIVRRVIDVTGLDLELASATTPAAEARRENLDLFVKSVAEFQSIDGDVSLTALLAYLTAEDEQGNGLDLAVPSQADSVKLLTVHRAKGLEWSSVFVACAGRTRFPSERGRTLWTSSPANIPAPLRGDAADLPQLQGFDKPALDAYREACKKHDATEELRLGYVALTRAARHLCFSSHVWGSRATAFGPSPYQRVVKESADAWGVSAIWTEVPDGKPSNPTLVDIALPSWPPPAGAEEARRRRAVASMVREAQQSLDLGDDSMLGPAEALLAEAWDAEIDRLVQERAEERTHEVDVALPASLSATALVRLREDPEGFTRDLARPMPRPPSPQARLGTRFHAWVESRFGQLDLLDPDDLPGRGDVGIEDEADLEALIAAFEAGPFSERVPVAVEAPFSLVLGGHVVRGRIDAVYADPNDPQRFLVVDWKTSRSDSADAVQLAIYRLAWAQLRDVPPDQVGAAFYFVRSGVVEEPDLLDEAELAAALLGAESL